MRTANANPASLSRIFRSYPSYQKLSHFNGRNVQNEKKATPLQNQTKRAFMSAVTANLAIATSGGIATTMILKFKPKGENFLLFISGGVIAFGLNGWFKELQTKSSEEKKGS